LSYLNFETTDKWQSFAVKFTLQNDTNDVEFRGVNVREKAPVSLRSIEVYPDTGEPLQPIPESVFYSEDLLIDQGILAKNGTFWHGPYASLPKGDYVAKFWLRLDGAYNGTLLDVDVATNSAKNVLTSLTVHSSNFETTDKWQSFAVKFTLQNDTNDVEFRGVNVREQAPVSLLAVEVDPDNGQPQQPIPKTIFNYGDLVMDQGIIVNGVMTHVKGNGTFWHGPYASLPKGDYVAKFWLRLDGAYNGTLLDIDVSIDPLKKALTFLTLSGSNFETIDKWQSFEVKFTLQNDLNIVEFRGVNIRDTAPVSLRSIEVYPDTGEPQQPIPKRVFYSEDLVMDQGIIVNGVMTHVKGNGTFWHGPYTSLPKGNYTVKYWLKLDKSYNGVLLDVDVATNSGKNVLTFLTLSGSNFETIDKWQSFEVKFTLQNDLNIVEFRGVNIRDTAPVSLRSIEVYPDTGG
jgi:hypothetical protein